MRTFPDAADDDADDDDDDDDDDDAADDDEVGCARSGLYVLNLRVLSNGSTSSFRSLSGVADANMLRAARTRGEREEEEREG